MKDTRVKTKAAPKKPAPKKPAPKKPAPKRSAAAKRPEKTYAARADLGAPIEGFFARQPAALRPIVDELRALVAAAAPDATSSIKWGMPVFEIGGAMMCAIGAHKAHVNLILAGPPGTFADPEGRLVGTGTTGKHLKLTSLADLPRAAARAWLAKAAATARAKA